MADESKDPGRQAPAQQAERSDEDRTAPRPFEARRTRVTDGLRLTAAQWKERAAAEFGVSEHAVAGALALRDPDESLSREQVQAELDDFAVRRGA